MEQPLQISFRGFKHTPELDQFIRKCAAELEQVAGNRMTSCHVVVQLGHEHATPAYHARIDLSVPGGVIAVNGESRGRLHHERAHDAVREAFDIARRELDVWEHRHHGEA